MFYFNPIYKPGALDLRDLSFFFLSVNEPVIASHNFGAQPARAYIVGIKRERGVEPFIAFFLLDAQDLEYYTARGLVSFKDSEKVVKIMLDFCESMGFVMEEINLQFLENEQKIKILDSCPLFYESIEEFLQRESREEEIEREIELTEEAEETSEEEIPLEEEVKNEEEKKSFKDQKNRNLKKEEKDDEE